MNRLQSRREFFKEASKKALPILGMAILASTPMLESCTKDPDPSECNGCSNNCEGNSTSSTCSSCSNNCENTSTSSGCSSCSDNCSSECTNDCSVNCSNSANNSSNDTISEASGSVDGHEYVDLGLSVMWARCNVNATRPQASGLYARIPYFSLSDQEQTNLMMSLGLYTGTSQDADLGGMTDFDLATERWGSNWKTPSDSEWQELKENCNLEAFELENVSGVKITSQINGNSIFIPLSGEYYDNSMHSVGSETILQSSTFNVQWVFIGGTFFELYTTSQGVIKSRFWAPMGYEKARPYVRAVTTGSGGGGSTNCNGNCTNTAQNTCSSCQVGCSTGCSQQCSSNCSTGCKTTCSGTCPNGCSTLCGGSCHYSCGGNCTYVSSGTHCTSGTCATTCSNYCYRTCSLACSESCMSCCVTSSK